MFCINYSSKHALFFVILSNIPNKYIQFMEILISLILYIFIILFLVQFLSYWIELWNSEIWWNGDEISVCALVWKWEKKQVRIQIKVNCVFLHYHYIVAPKEFCNFTTGNRSVYVFFSINEHATFQWNEDGWSNKRCIWLHWINGKVIGNTSRKDPFIDGSEDLENICIVLNKMKFWWFFADTLKMIIQILFFQNY